VILYGTGELLLFLLTLGRRKPSLRALSKRRNALVEELFTEAGFWAGAAFYAGLALVLIGWLN